jgi:UDP-N-acetylmuramoyl-tripeptide--D-alanyl-D-alanine ligase
MRAVDIATALNSVSAPPQRGEVIRFAEGFTVINDSYNSNPAALLSMIDTLMDGSSSRGRRIIVAGEMLELGASEAAIHCETGEKIAASGADVLIGVRGLAKELTEGAAAAGMTDVHFADDSEVAGVYLAEIVRTGDIVLIKGSRGVRTEKVLDKLFEKFHRENSASGRAVK